MIKNFKIFERHLLIHLNGTQESIPDDEDDLIELFSQQEVEDYFDKYYEITAEEVSQGLNVWNYVDDDEIKNFFIEEMIDQNKDNVKTKRELREYYEEKWEDTEPSEIFEEIWGKGARYDTFNYIPNKFIDTSSMIEDYRNMIDYEVKNDFIRDSISSDINLQKKLFLKNKNTVMTLFDVMSISYDSFGNTYEFQKEYIKQNVEIENFEDRDEIISHTIKEINDKFELNSDIKNEYKDYLYLIDAEKYNL